MLEQAQGSAPLKGNGPSAALTVVFMSAVVVNFCFYLIKLFFLDLHELNSAQTGIETDTRIGRTTHLAIVHLTDKYN